MSIRGLSGYGTTSTRSYTPTGQKATIPSLFSEFTITKNATYVDSKAYPIGGNGEMELIAHYATETNWTMTTKMGFYDWGGFQLAFGEFDSTTASIKHREGYAGNIPSSSPYEIQDDALTGLAVSDVTVSIATTSTVAYRPLKVITGTPATGEVKLDSANGKLIFNSAQTGLPFIYYLLNTYSSIQTLGVEPLPVLLDEVEFEGVLRLISAPNKIGVNAPSIAKSGNSTFNAGDNTMEFVPTASGSNRSAVRFLNFG